VAVSELRVDGAGHAEEAVAIGHRVIAEELLLPEGSASG
jgi:hypothetical protein